MFESFEVVDGGTSPSVAAAPDASAVSAPLVEGEGGTTPNDAPLGCVGPTLKCAALYLRKVAPMGAMT